MKKITFLCFKAFIWVSEVIAYLKIQFCPNFFVALKFKMS